MGVQGSLLVLNTREGGEPGDEGRARQELIIEVIPFNSDLHVSMYVCRNYPVVCICKCVHVHCTCVPNNNYLCTCISLQMPEGRVVSPTDDADVSRQNYYVSVVYI